MKVNRKMYVSVVSNLKQSDIAKTSGDYPIMEPRDI